MHQDDDSIAHRAAEEARKRLGINGTHLRPVDEYPEERRGDAWEPRVEGTAETHESNGAPVERRRITAADVATIEDLIRAGSQVRWLWPGWIPQGVLTALASEGGKGKTRFCADLMRRVRHRFPWPDGAAMSADPDGLWLWVMADNHHDEIVSLSLQFDIAPNIRINALKSDPYGGVTLETAEDLTALDARIHAIQPAMVVIDTVGNATDKNLSKQEDAKAFYFPLQVLARRHRCGFLCLTHLNAGGTFLGRRVLEKVRVAIRMQQPEGEERRRLEVIKSNSKKPPALGLTMADNGNEYDANPPEVSTLEPGAKPGRPDPKVQDCADWLAAQLEKGPRKVSTTRHEAEECGFTVGTLYRAMRLLRVEEYEADGRKWWRPGSDGNPFS